MVVGIVGRPRVGKTVVAQLLANVVGATQFGEAVYMSDSDTSVYLNNARYRFSDLPEDYDEQVRELVEKDVPNSSIKRLFVQPFGPEVKVGVIGGFLSDICLTHDIMIKAAKAFSDKFVVMDVNAKQGTGNYLELMDACNVVIAVGMCDNYIFDMLTEYDKDIESNRVLAYKHLYLINRYDDKMKNIKVFDKALKCGQRPLHTLAYNPALKKVIMNGEYRKLQSSLRICHPELEAPTKSAIEVLQHLYDTKTKKIIKPYGEWL
ncbi:hypothetical protein [Bacteroides acidifaciens]|uniref:hypothetical protein n=1 Tax=Bacteroides acidifaciens TaxID=85831 RepID=UPI0025A945B1|nr:hypothetical protein [Bacteroides acidifaciens]